MKSRKLRTALVAAALAAGFTSAAWAPGAIAQEQQPRTGAPAGGVAVLATASATVKAVDAEKRTVTVETPSGATAVFKCGKEVINFDQIKPGDQIRATLIERLAISVGKPTSPPNVGEAGIIAAAPKGAKPGVLIAHTSQMTAKIDSIDPQARTVTLQGPEGKSQTIKVAPGVDLTGVKAGEDVTVRLTEGLALVDEKQQQQTPEDAARTAAATIRPGAAMIEGRTVMATVDAVDREKRLVTLKDAESGATRTIHLGKEAVNFDQIKVGDRVRATLAEEVAVAVSKGAGQQPGAAEGALVARAPQGTKPGVIVATTTRVEAKIQAIDPAQRTITLAEAQGKPRTIKVAPGVDLTQLKAGDDVTAQCTLGMAIVDEGQ